MKSSTKPLPTDVKKLQVLLVEKELEIQKLQEKNLYLLEQFRLAQHVRFGRSSEVQAGQGELFNEAESIVDDILDEAIVPEKETQRTPRKKPKRKPLPKDLPREIIVVDLTDEEKVCDGCGHDLHQMGEKTREQLKFIPAQIKVIQTVRPQYSCRHCEKNGTHVSIKIAPAPKSPIPKGIATPSLLSQIITHKYQYSLPLYRQEALFKQHGIELNRKTMSEWMIKTSALFKPLVNRLHQALLTQPVIQADESTLNVLNEAKTNCYMWVYCSGTDSPRDHGIKNIVLYDYQASRAGKCAVDYLKGFNGYLQADGYSGYEQVKAELIGCMAHARRKFVEAQTAEPKNKRGRATFALNTIAKLYRIEKNIKELPANEKTAIREEHALPILNDFKKWLEKSIQQVLPKSAIGKAIQYSLNQWDKLSGYIKNGDINIDNNRAERAIKPFVIGRKNWMFFGSAAGGEVAATMYTLIASAARHQLDLWAYVDNVLRCLAAGAPNLEELLPDRWKKTHPESIRTYRKDEQEARQTKKRARRAQRRNLAGQR